MSSLARKNIYKGAVSVAFFIAAAIGISFFATAPSAFSPSQAHAAAPNPGLTGWAWSENVGWICFYDATYCPSAGVSDDGSGNLTGYAWNDNIGWIQFGGLSGFPQAKTVYLTSGSSWTVPSDWNNSNNTIEVIGGGGGGASTENGTARYATGGGGGGYAKATNVTLTPSAKVGYKVGSGGLVSTLNFAGHFAGKDGGDTYFCNSTTFCSPISSSAVVVDAEGGSGGNASYTTAIAGGLGGLASSAKGGAGGSVANPGAPYAYSGGNGGDVLQVVAGALSTGGGGAAGSSGAGNDGGDLTSDAASSGGAGDANNGGSGGSKGYGITTGWDGSNGTEWGSVYGSGGGGGGVRAPDSSATATAGDGGNYGAGGGGVTGNSGTITSGAGAPGVIIITYTPSTPSGSNATISSGVIRGWAKALSANNQGWDGWISLNGSTGDGGFYHAQTDGSHSYAWGGDVIGWIDFSNVVYNNIPTCTLTPQVQTIAIGDTANLTYSTTGSPSSISYTVDAGSPITPSGGTISIPSLATGPHNIVMSLNGGAATCPATVTVSAPPAPSNIVLTATPSRVHKGANTALSWTGSNLPATCTISATPSVAGFPKDVPSGASSGSYANAGPINQKTIFTLTCTSASGQATVGIVPVYQEI